MISQEQTRSRVFQDGDEYDEGGDKKGSHGQTKHCSLHSPFLFVMFLFQKCHLEMDKKCKGKKILFVCERNSAQGPFVSKDCE